MSEITEKLKVLGEKWANLPDCKGANEIADEVMEELPELLRKTEELEGACAEMRDLAAELLKQLRCNCHDIHPKPCYYCQCKDKIESTSCGSNYIHRDEVRRLRDALKSIRDFDDNSPWDDPGACAADALQRCDCGENYIHRDEVRELIRDVVARSNDTDPAVNILTRWLDEHMEAK